MKNDLIQIRHFTHNVFWQFVIQAANAIAFIGLTPYLSRVIGVDHIGYLLLGYSIVSFTQIIADLSFNQIGTKFVSDFYQTDEKSDVWKYITASIVSKLIVITPIVAIYILWVSLGGFDNNSIKQYLMYLVGAIVFQALMPVWVYQGVSRVAQVAKIIVLGRLAFVVLCVSIVDENNWQLIGLFSTISYFVSLVSSYYDLKRLGLNITKPSFDVVKSQVTSGLRLSALKNIYVFAMQLPLYVASSGIIGRQGFSAFAAVDQLYKAATSAMYPLNNSAYLSYLNNKNKMVINTLIMVLAIGLSAVSVVVVLFNEEILRIYLGYNFSSYSGLLVIYSFIFCISSISTIINNTFVSIDISYSAANKNMAGLGFLLIFSLSILGITNNLSWIRIAFCLLTCEILILLYRIRLVLKSNSKKISSYAIILTIKKYFNHLGDLITFLFFYILFRITKIVIKKDPRFVVFGAWYGMRYADNSRIVFEEINSNPSVDALWVTRNKKLNSELINKKIASVYLYSMRGIMAMAKAHTAICTHGVMDFGRIIRKDTYLIYLSHGTPLKKIGYDAVSDNIVNSGIGQKVISLLLNKKNIDLIYCSSEIAKKRFSTALGLEEEKIKVSFFPRWRHFAESDLSEQIKKYIKSDESKSILYAPTLRDFGLGTINFCSGNELDRLLQTLKKTNTTLFVRPHPALKMNGVADAINKSAGSIKWLGSDILDDITIALPYIDALITDYSSVIYDFSVFKRPVIIFAPDYEDYQNINPGLYDRYELENIGPLFKNWDDISTYISQLSFDSVNDNVKSFYLLHGAQFHSSSLSELVEEILTRIKNNSLEFK